MMNTLRELFLASVVDMPHHVLLSDASRSLTYQLASEEAAARAHALLDAGAQPGDRLIIVDADSFETSLWMLACCLSGIVFIILHRDTSAMRMHYLLQDIEPVGVIDSREHISDLYQHTPAPMFVFKIWNRNAQESTAVLEFTEPILATDPACLVYTSGSTGTPKGIICSQQNMLAVISAINAYLPNTSEDIIGVLLSLSFVYGLYQLFLAIHARATVSFIPGFHSPLELLTQIKERHITALPLTRTILVSLVRISGIDQYLKELKYATFAGDFIPASLIRTALTIFADIQLFYMYGLSECARALYMPPHRLKDKPDSVGISLPGTRCYLLNEKKARCAPGEIGELIVEGPHVMNGYWKSPQETLDKFVPGPYSQIQLHTGDLFTQDTAGDFYFVGRKNDMIKCRGFRISPREVESAMLAADPLLRECIVYGIEDTLLGQAIIAEVIITDPAHSVFDIFACCRAHMDNHLVPTKILPVEKLRTTASGKYYRRLDSERAPNE